MCGVDEVSVSEGNVSDYWSLHDIHLLQVQILIQTLSYRLYFVNYYITSESPDHMKLCQFEEVMS